MEQPGAFLGPRVPEGTYRVKLIVGDKAYQAQVTLTPDPRFTDSREDRALQDRTAMRLYDMVQRLTYLVDAVIDLRDQAKARAAGLKPNDRLARRLGAYADTLDRFRASLVSTSSAGRMGGEELLREKLVSLYGAVNGYEGRPTVSQLEQVEVLAGRLDAAGARVETLTGTRLAALNRELVSQKLAPLAMLARDQWDKR